jgi:hypothetical protein
MNIDLHSTFQPEYTVYTEVFDVKNVMCSSLKFSLSLSLETALPNDMEGWVDTSHHCDVTCNMPQGQRKRVIISDYVNCFTFHDR